MPTLPQWAKIGFQSFVGKVVAYFFVAVCIAIGFGPEQWATFALQGTTLLTPKLLRIGLISLGVLTVAFLFAPVVAAGARALKLRAFKLRNNVVEYQSSRRNVPALPQEAKLLLVNRNEQFVLTIESIERDREFDIRIDLTEADIPAASHGRYSAVWLNGRFPERRSIPKGRNDYVSIYMWEDGHPNALRDFYFLHHVGNNVQRTKTNISQKRPLNQVYKRSIVKMDISANPQFRDGAKTVIFSIEGRIVTRISGEFEIT